MLDTLFLQQFILPGLDVVYLLLLVIILFTSIGAFLLWSIKQRLQHLEIVELDIKQILIAIRNKLK